MKRCSMQDLTIEWRHYEKEGATCDRCAATGASIKDVVAEMAGELSAHGIKVTFSETVLPVDLIAQSNMILFNGVPLEEVLGDAQTSETDCPSCGCLTGTQTSCRTIERGGMTFEEVPAGLIREAIMKMAGVELE